jgi:hypothetical protein
VSINSSSRNSRAAQTLIAASAAAKHQQTWTKRLYAAAAAAAACRTVQDQITAGLKPYRDWQDPGQEQLVALQVSRGGSSGTGSWNALQFMCVFVCVCEGVQSMPGPWPGAAGGDASEQQQQQLHQLCIMTNAV